MWVLSQFINVPHTEAALYTIHIHLCTGAMLHMLHLLLNDQLTRPSRCKDPPIYIKCHVGATNMASGSIHSVLHQQCSQLPWPRFNHLPWMPTAGMLRAELSHGPGTVHPHGMPHGNMSVHPSCYVTWGDSLDVKPDLLAMGIVPWEPSGQSCMEKVVRRLVGLEPMAGHSLDGEEQLVGHSHSSLWAAVAAVLYIHTG